MSASTFLKTENPGSSISRGLRDLQNPDAKSNNNDGRSLYSLPLNDSKEQFSYGVYGATGIPVHGVEKESSSSPLGNIMDGSLPAERRVGSN